jgi:1,4-alpha-glucan branching enzyme
MTTGTLVEYARERMRGHVLNFNHLYDEIRHGGVDEGWLNEIERRHNVFPDIDDRV